MPDSSGRSTNPIFGDQPFKVGLFAYLHRSGMTLTKAPERWQCKWDDIAAMARMADQGGMDFLIPVSSWKGWKGEVDQRRWSFETLTHAAALSGITSRIGLFSTVHVPLVHPVFVAKAMATIDHASHGRAGLNIVCGWNKADFDMFGVPMLPHEERYDYGQEWFDIFRRIVADGENDFDYDGKYFPGLKNISGEPGTVQRPHPAIISAALSDNGRDFAINTSDVILTAVVDPDTDAEQVAAIRKREAEKGRTKPLTIIGSLTITCRKTREEAEAFDHYFSVEQADNKAIDIWLEAQKGRSFEFDMPMEARRRSSAGSAVVVGSPQDLVDVLVKLKEAGFDGVGLQPLNYLDDLPLILDEVLPLMEEAGLRTPALEAAA